MKNIKTQKEIKVQGIKLKKQIMTLHSVTQEIKDRVKLKNKIIDELKVFQDECPIVFDHDTFKFVLDISTQIRNVFNQSEFKEQHTDLFHKFVTQQQVTIVKVDKR